MIVLKILLLLLVALALAGNQTAMTVLVHFIFFLAILWIFATCVEGIIRFLGD